MILTYFQITVRDLQTIILELTTPKVTFLLRKLIEWVKKEDVKSNSKKFFDRYNSELRSVLAVN